METIRIQTARGLLIGKMVDDDVKQIMEDQHIMREQINIKLKLAGNIELF